MKIVGFYILTKEQLDKEKEKSYGDGKKYGIKLASAYSTVFIDDTIKKIRGNNYIKKIKIIREYIKRMGE